MKSIGRVIVLVLLCISVGTNSEGNDISESWVYLNPKITHHIIEQYKTFYDASPNPIRITVYGRMRKPFLRDESPSHSFHHQSVPFEQKIKEMGKELMRQSSTCASWNASHYLWALIGQSGKAVPRSCPFVENGDEYIYLAGNESHNFYVHKDDLNKMYRLYDLWENAEFVKFLEQLPGFETFVEEIHTKIGKDGGFWSPHAQKLIHDKATEYERKRQQRKKDERESIRQENIQWCLQEHENIKERLNSCASMPSFLRSLYEQREEALNQLQHHQGANFLRSYRVPPETLEFARQYGIDPFILKHRYYHDYQHQLHKELLTNLTYAARKSSLYTIHTVGATLIDTIGAGARVALVANTQHNGPVATEWTDFVYKTAAIMEGIGRGVLLSAYGLADLAVHPIESIKKMVHGTYMIGCLLIHAVEKHVHLTSLFLQGRRHDYDNELDALCEQTVHIITHLYDQFASLSIRDKAQYISHGIADIALPALIGMSVGRICTTLAPLATELSAVIAEKVPQTVNAITSAVEVMAGDIPIVQTAEGITIAATDMVKTVGSTLATGAQEIALTIESVHAAYMTALETEMVTLRPLFDGKVKGLLECTNKFLKFDYKHILGMELKLIKEGLYKLSGFHHDFMNFIEKKGLIQFANKVMYKEGFYSANIIVNGRCFNGKTFFPAEWSREKVVSKVFEAYNNFIKSGGIPDITSDGKYRILGWIEEGIELEMFITPRGKIATVYPLLK